MDNPFTCKNINGRTYYYHYGKRIAKALVPPEYLLNIQKTPAENRTDRHILSSTIEKGNSNNISSSHPKKETITSLVLQLMNLKKIQGYTYFQGMYTKMYFLNGEKIIKRQIPNLELKNLKNIQEQWDKITDENFVPLRERLYKLLQDKRNAYYSGISSSSNASGTTNPPGNLSDDDECCVCLEVITNKISLECKHNLCFSCANKLRNTTCPQCRQEMKGPFFTPTKMKEIGDRRREDMRNMYITENALYLDQVFPRGLEDVIIEGMIVLMMQMN